MGSTNREIKVRRTIVSISMNRILKFRGWHKERKEMMEVVNIHLSFLNASLCVKDDPENKTNQCDWVLEQGYVCEDHPDSPIVLMQYTNCHDKNGQEIFEHDLIEYEKFTRVVLFRHGAFVAVDELGKWILVEPHLLQNGAVKVGNIWQNEKVEHRKRLLAMIVKTVNSLTV